MATAFSINQVQSMYVAYYGRPGDPAGVNWWADVLDRQSGRLDDILPAFGNSQEYLARFGALNTEAIITRFYQQILNRSPDAPGLAWWKAQYETGKSSLTDIAKRLWDGASGIDLVTRDNKLAVAKTFTAQVESTGGRYAAADIDAAVALLAAVDANSASVQQAQTQIVNWFTLGPDPNPPPIDPAEPTAYEQFILELINWERTYPDRAAAYYGIDLNEGLAPGTLPSGARQPLAMNLDIIEAARDHSAWMLANDVFSHQGAGGSTFSERMTAAGYEDWIRAAENIAWWGTTGTYTKAEMALEVERLEENLFVDEGIAGRGHRVNILNPDLKEVGIGIALGDMRGYNAIMLTEDFGTRRGDSFLLGVVFDDDAVQLNGFYDPGEGLGGARVTATNLTSNRTYVVDTFASGGYQMALPNGIYDVRFDYAGGTAGIQVELAGLNVKVDWEFDFLML